MGDAPPLVELASRLGFAAEHLAGADGGTHEQLLTSGVSNRGGLVAHIHLAQHLLAVDHEHSGRDVLLEVVHVHGMPLGIVEVRRLGEGHPLVVEAADVFGKLVEDLNKRKLIIVR